MRKKFAHLEEKSLKELYRDVTASKIELLALKMQHARNTLKNPLLIREKRRFVARLCTLISVKEKEGRSA